MILSRDKQSIQQYIEYSQQELTDKAMTTIAAMYLLWSSINETRRNEHTESF